MRDASKMAEQGALGFHMSVETPIWQHSTDSMPLWELQNNQYIS